MRQVVEIILPRTTYASAKSCANGLWQQFDVRGWPRRERIAATIAANNRRSGRLPGEDRLSLRRRKRAAKVGVQPMCGAIVISWGRRRGQPCLVRAQRGSDFCVSHDPARAAERAATLEKARAAVAA